MQSLDAPAIQETVKGILFSLCDVKAKRGGEKRRGLWLFDVTYRIKIML